MSDFESFMATRIDAASAYMRGDGDPVSNLSTAQEPATFFGPDGKVARGATTIAESYRKGAKSFGPHGESRLEILQQASDDKIAYWAGLQHAVVETDGKSTPMTLRITELFRKEDDEWKLVHRQADMMKA
ncbi:YybH family protein [Asticcacaulis solisilvae]|uniref:YybH family protein n=1 Tax=Asticcacaulis solisilvae TaxID=1217274 RepID=UPI003FD6E357